MIYLTLHQAEVLQEFINDMLEIHDLATPSEEEVFAVLSAAIDAENDKN